MSIYSIYLVTCTVNGKHYVGFASNFDRRKREHLAHTFDPHYQDYNTTFHRAIRKYGVDAFIWEVVFQSRDCTWLKNEMEAHFIREYASYHSGYNMTLGGDGATGLIRTKEHTDKINASRSKTMQDPIWAKRHGEKTCWGMFKNKKTKDILTKFDEILSALPKYTTPYGLFTTLRDAAEVEGVSKQRISQRLKDTPATYRKIEYPMPEPYLVERCYDALKSNPHIFMEQAKMCLTTRNFTL